MLHNIKELTGFSVGATDGEIGKVKDAYFDDQRWAIRHLVVDTGGWLSERKGSADAQAVSTCVW